MITVNGELIEIKHFPDGTILINYDTNCDIQTRKTNIIEWYFENNEEMTVLLYITRHLQCAGANDINLVMPYIPNARQDRVKNSDDIFTLKYFSEFINSLNFNKVIVFDPHSYVSEALLNNLTVISAKSYISTVIDNITSPNGENVDQDNFMLFYPDEGSMKRYSGFSDYPYAFGIKRRDWKTGKILGLDVSGNTEKINGSNILIVDDICSKGGTFYHSATKLKELGANKIYLYVSHCENTIFSGEIFNSGLIEKVYTTNTILDVTTEEARNVILNNKMKVYAYEN